MFWNRKLRDENAALRHCLEMNTKGIRLQIEKLEDAIIEVRKEIAKGPHTCDVCGCLVAAGRQIKGKSEIRTRENFNLSLSYVFKDEEYIHIPYYCGRCAPKEEKRNDRE